MESLLSWYATTSSWELFWLGFGLIGQVMFGLRFIVQWIVSERQGASVIPLAFWYLSIGGSIMLFIYATYRLDPVFMLGQGTGCFIYVRNLILIGRNAEPSPEGKP